MALDLNFSGYNTRYATHGLHSYAAKCPPQLVKYCLDEYSNEGDLVLDQMAGSGTTLVEAKINGRSAIGFDIDPLACLIASVKTRVIDDESIKKASSFVISSATKDIQLFQNGSTTKGLLQRCVAPLFLNRDYWFSELVQRELALLSYYIQIVQADENTRDFLWVAFSGIILTKVSVANARDIIHSRHHYFSHQEQPKAIERFEKRVQLMRRQMNEFRKLCADSTVTVEIQKGDARELTLIDDSVDLVFTSPPYATALDYPRAHFLAVSWMKPVFGTTLDEYKSKGKGYIGSERGQVGKFEEDASLGGFACSTVKQLAQIDQRRAVLVQRYFQDMKKVLKETSRVLRPGKFAILVVCPSHIRKLQIPTHKVFTDIAVHLGLVLISEHERTIDSRKRVLPYVRESFGDRMSTEYVLVYKKGE
jgi:DNA modification methylase